MLVQPGAWDTDSPQIRPGIEPRVATAVRVQQRLALQLVAYRQTNKLTKEALAEQLHMSRAQLWRLVDGHAPMTLLQVCAIAGLLGLEQLRFDGAVQ